MLQAVQSWRVVDDLGHLLRHPCRRLRVNLSIETTTVTSWARGKGLVARLLFCGRGLDGAAAAKMQCFYDRRNTVGGWERM